MGNTEKKYLLRFISVSVNGWKYYDKRINVLKKTFDSYLPHTVLAVNSQKRDILLFNETNFSQSLQRINFTENERTKYKTPLCCFIFTLNSGIPLYSSHFMIIRIFLFVCLFFNEIKTHKNFCTQRTNFYESKQKLSLS